MSLVDEVVQSQRGGVSVLQQIQNASSAVEEMVNYFSKAKWTARAVVKNKIERMHLFAENRASVSDLSDTIYSWLMGECSVFGAEILRKQQDFIEGMIKQLLAKTFPQGDEEWRQIVEQSLVLLEEIDVEIERGGTPSRQKLREFDELERVVEEMISQFGRRIERLNFGVLRLLKRVKQFQQLINLQFREYVSKEDGQQNLTPVMSFGRLQPNNKSAQNRRQSLSKGGSLVKKSLVNTDNWSVASIPLNTSEGFFKREASFMR